MKKSFKAKVIELVNAKKAQASAGINKAVATGFTLIGVAILFQIVTAVLPIVSEAGDNLSAQGGLFTLFAAGGILFVIIAAVILGRVFKDLAGSGR